MLMVMLMLMGAGGAWAYDPTPQLIWLLDASRYNQDSESQMFYDFTGIGDQNGDGCDELLISQEPIIRGYNQPDGWWANCVELYLGNRDEMSNEPAYVFEAQDSLESLGLAVTYLGALTANDAHDFAIWTAKYWSNPAHPNWDRRLYHELRLYKGGGGRFDLEPDYVIRQYTDTTLADEYEAPGGIFPEDLGRPCDLNGDGFDDLVVWLNDLHGNRGLTVFWGGDDFDITPDLVFADVSGEVETGDFNGDGYDDLIVTGNQINFFLGGNPPTCESVLTIRRDQFEGWGFDLPTGLLDVNGDGCDDWTLGMHRLEELDTMPWFFYGGDSLDAEPDYVIPTYITKICGGDVNGDGYGDIITGTNIWFGAPWFPESGRYFWREDSLSTYDYANGAYFDYNGDGVFDHVIKGAKRLPRMVIYAGSRDWQVGVSNEEQPIDAFPIKLISTPSPFNSSTTLTYTLPYRGQYELGIYDLSGRLVRALAEGVAEAGEHSVVWSAPGSGVYFAVLEVGGEGKAVRKVVCVR